jgi:hypothetical protein
MWIRLPSFTLTNKEKEMTVMTMKTTHDELFDVHFCPDCTNYWVYDTTCGYLMTSSIPIQITEDLKAYFECPTCKEPFSIDDPKHMICPVCKYWNEWGEYMETVEEWIG